MKFGTNNSSPRLKRFPLRWAPAILLALATLCAAFWIRAHYSDHPWSAQSRALENSFRIVDPDEDRPPARDAQGQIVRPPRRFDTFAHWALDVESESRLVSPDRYARLDQLIADVAARVRYDSSLTNPRAQRGQAIRILHAIDQVLTEYNVLYPPGEYDVTSLAAGFCPQALDGRTLDHLVRIGFNQRRRDHALGRADQPFLIMDCDITSIAYLGVGDALGIELHLVDLPDHMFVRWVLSDGSYVNWDTNEAADVEDREFIEAYELTRRQRRQRVYMATLTRAEARGYVYSLSADRHNAAARYDLAIADYRRSLELYPQATQNQAALARLYATVPGLETNWRREAVKLAQNATKIEPQCAEFWDALAVADAGIGDFEQARKFIDRALDLVRDEGDRKRFRDDRKFITNGKVPQP